MEEPNHVPLNPDWTVIELILTAQENTRAGLEQYILYAAHDDFDLNQKETEVCLDQAIAAQERALENLKTAQKLIKES